MDPPKPVPTLAPPPPLEPLPAAVCRPDHPEYNPLIASKHLEQHQQVATAISRDAYLPELPVRSDVTPHVLGLDEEFGGSLGTSDQMLARGPQDYLLTLPPQATFFPPSTVYKRHTAFAQETFEDEMRLVLGHTTTVELQRRGDVLGSVFLEISLPNLSIPGGRWADAIAYVLMSRVRLFVGETVIHDQERLWYDLVDRLYMPEAKRSGLDTLIGRGRVLATDRAHVVYLPFKFMCCKGHYANQQFLPLVALPTTTKVKVEFRTESLARCLVLPSGSTVPTGVATLNAKLLSEQVFVEQDEQRALMRRPHFAMIEEAQDQDALTYQFDDNATYDVASVSVDLSELNLPVKALAFVAYDENDATSGTYFRYLDCVDAAVLNIGSSQRFSPRDGRYFSLVQTYQHCTRCTKDNVHVYSFALDASVRQPSGALNFAVVQRPVLRVDLKNADGLPVKVKVFAQCINWIRIDSGSLTHVFT